MFDSPDRILPSVADLLLKPALCTTAACCSRSCGIAADRFPERCSSKRRLQRARILEPPSAMRTFCVRWASAASSCSCSQAGCMQTP